MPTELGELLAMLNNDMYLVRHYRRNRLRRKQAIQKLGADLRFVFSVSDEYEAILETLLEGLRPEDRLPF